MLLREIQGNCIFLSSVPISHKNYFLYFVTTNTCLVIDIVSVNYVNYFLFSRLILTKLKKYTFNITFFSKYNSTKITFNLTNHVKYYTYIIDSNY